MSDENFLLDVKWELHEFAPCMVLRHKCSNFEVAASKTTFKIPAEIQQFQNFNLLTEYIISLALIVKNRFFTLNLKLGQKFEKKLFT